MRKFEHAIGLRGLLGKITPEMEIASNLVTQISKEKETDYHTRIIST